MSDSLILVNSFLNVRHFANAEQKVTVGARKFNLKLKSSLCLCFMACNYVIQGFRIKHPSVYVILP